MRIGRSRHGAVLVVALGLAVAGVAGGWSLPQSVAAAASNGAPTGTPLKIGWVGPLTGATGPAAGTGLQALDSLKAWVKWTNAHGGVNGHPIQGYYEDDQSDPAVGTSDVQDLVQNKHVIAIVGELATTTEGTWASYVLSKRIPVVGGPLNDTLWFTNAMFYPIGATILPSIWGQMKAAKAAGAKKIAVILCTELAACAQAQPLFAADAKSAGLDLVYSTLASQTAVSYTAQCLAAKAAGATAVAAFIDQTVMALDCSRQGYNPSYINSTLAPTRETLKAAPQIKSAVGSTQIWPCLAPNAAGVATFQTAMKRYGYGEFLQGGSRYDQATGYMCVGWSSGVAFAKAIENAGVPAKAVVTSEDVIKGLSKFHNETLGGLAPKITLGDGSAPNPAQNCMWLYKWTGLKLSLLPPSGALTCQPAAT